MSRILIVEDDVAQRHRMVEAFTQLGLTVQECDRAIRAFAVAIAAPSRTIVLSAGGFSGLEAHVLLRDEYRFSEGNHPDGWYRKFYDDTNRSISPKANPRGSQGGRKFSRCQWR